MTDSRERGRTGMATHERGKIRIAWVETDAPPPAGEVAFVETAPVVEAPPVVVDQAERASIAASRERILSSCLWAVACGGFAGLEGWVFPAFSTMFREAGARLPAVTEAVVGTPGVVYGLGVLTLLHAATNMRSAESRGKLRIAAFLALMLGLGLTLYALFVPLISDQRM